MSARFSFHFLYLSGLLLLIALSGCDIGKETELPIGVRSTSSSSSSSSSAGMATASSSSSSSSSSSGLIPEGYSLVYAVNVGGPATVLDKVAFAADRYSTGGENAGSKNPIGGTSEPALYQTQRFGNFKYEIPVTEATYGVRLFFAELLFLKEKERVFDVAIEGKKVLEDMDVFAKVGRDVALNVLVEDIKVDDGYLTIELTSKIDNATLGGIAIFSNTGGRSVPPSQLTGCDLPTYIQWTSSTAIIKPQKGYESVKDPTIVYDKGKYHVFATAFSNTSNFYESIYLSFSDFNEAGAAKHIKFAPGGSAVAPQVFYFRPHKRWYIVTQWPARYTSTTDISDPQSWEPLKPFWPNDTGGDSRHSNALDYWVICDKSTCYMFFFKDDGKMYQVKTPIEKFPEFDIAKVTVANVPSAGSQNVLFEAGNVYKLKGQDKYLLVVEGWGISEGQRLYRGWVSKTLDGPWMPYKITEKAPFAGLNNVTFPDGQWSQQISHGELVRAGRDETMELDACRMRFLYQGVDLNGYKGDYNARPYKLGLLTAD